MRDGNALLVTLVVIAARSAKSVLEKQGPKIAKQIRESGKDCFLPGPPLPSILDRRRVPAKGSRHRSKPDANPSRFRRGDNNAGPILPAFGIS